MTDANPSDASAELERLRRQVAELELQRQDTLRQSQGMMQALLDSSTEGVLLLDTEGRFLALNEAAARTFGRSVAELIGADIYALLPPELAASRRAIAQEVMRTGQPVRFVDRRQERWLDSSLCPLRDGQGRIVGLSIFARDITEQRQAQEELVSAKTRLQHMLESSPAVIYTCLGGGDHDINSMSSNVRAMTGFSAQQLMTPGFWFARVHPDDQPGLECELARLDSADYLAHEYRFRHADGAYRWMRDELRLVRDAQGRRLEWAGFWADISARKQAEEALRAAKERLQYVFDNISDAIFEIDLEGRYTFASQAAERMTGYRLDELIGMPMQRLVAPEFHALLQERVARRMAGDTLGQPFVFDIIRRDKQRLTVELTTAGAHAGGKLVAIHGIARDITERKRAEQAIADLQRQIEFVLEATKTGLDIIDADYNVHYVGPGWAKIYGEDYRGRKCYEYFRRGSRPCENCGIPEALARREIVVRENSPVHDPSAAMQVTTMPFQCDGGRWLVAEVNFDITERKAAEAALRAAHGKLAQAREEERKHLAGELHDSVGQALVALELGLHGLAGDLPPPQGGRLARLCDQLNSLVREVRLISRGLYPPTLESLGLCSALNQLAQNFHSQAQVRVHCAIPPEMGRLPPEVEIALFRVAQEAISNAVRHARAAKIDLALSYERGQAVLTIANPGECFDPRAVTGNGLGLTMMRERMQALGGELSITSRRRRTRVRASVATQIIPPRA